MTSCALTGESLQTDISFARGYSEAWESIRPEDKVPCFSSYNKRASELQDARCAALDAASREPFRLGWKTALQCASALGLTFYDQHGNWMPTVAPEMLTLCQLSAQQHCALVVQIRELRERAEAVDAAVNAADDRAVAAERRIGEETARRCQLEEQLVEAERGRRELVARNGELREDARSMKAELAALREGAVAADRRAEMEAERRRVAEERARAAEAEAARLEEAAAASLEEAQSPAARRATAHAHRRLLERRFRSWAAWRRARVRRLLVAAKSDSEGAIAAACEFCKVAVEAGDVRQLQEAAERTQVLLLLDEDAGECEVEIEAFRKLLVVLESHLAKALAARGVTDAQAEAARRMGATREALQYF
jgi:hypothetical protein